MIRKGTMLNLMRRSLPAMLLLAAPAAAQTLPAFVSPMPDGYMQRATLMDATDNFNGVIDQLDRLYVLTGENDAFLLAKAYYTRGDRRCIALLEDFAARNPASPYANDARLLVGDFYFFAHEFGPALTAYEGAEIAGLGSHDRAMYTYRKALCQVKTGYYDEAAKGLRKLTDNATYGAGANFYLAYIDYVEGRDNKAYEEFARVASMSNSKFPAQNCYYYMSQIEFAKGRYEDVMSRAGRLLNSDPEPQMVPELNRLMGESLFKEGEAGQAMPYLEKYLRESGDSAARDAIYTLAVCYYDDADYDRAYDLFSRLTDEPDALCQSAYLYIGQCLARRGDNSGAAMAFDKAYRMNHDDAIAETALYNYISATTRGGNVPFSSSIPMLDEFINSYPQSKYAPRVEQYLAAAYFNERDYEKALQSINRITKPDAAVLSAKQKILFELGRQMIAAERPAEAEKYLAEARSLDRYDKKLATQADLWLADALYAQHKYAEAEKSYASYLKGDARGENRPLALYNMAYSLYMQDKFKEALSYFNQALEARPALNDVLAADARLRKADCLYYTGDLDAASALYSQAMRQGAADADYAALRKAIIEGVNGNNQAKVEQLDKLMKDYPNSKWTATALLEKAIACSEMGDKRSAVAAYTELSERFPQVPQTRNALLQMAEIYADEGDIANATETYKRIIATWPSSEQAALANDDLREIYAAEGSLDAYAAWLKSIPGAPQLDTAEIERLTFEAAETAYNNVGGTDERLLRYVEQYPNGAYVAQALRDIAQYRYAEQHDAAGAIEAIDKLVAMRPDASQVPGALMLKAEILEKTRPGDAEVLEAWRLLEKRGGSDYAIEAWSGIMRNTASDSERLDYARRLRDAGGLSAEGVDEAHYYEALSLEHMGKRKEAMEIYAELAENPMTLSGARGAVALGEGYLAAKQYRNAINAMLKFTSSGTPHSYWVARGYITLADAYTATGEKSLAREYLTSVRDNYPGREKDIMQMIDSRLKKLK